MTREADNLHIGADFYDRVGREHLAALWQVMAGLITPSPRSACMPALWRYDTVRRYLVEAAGLISAERAERRVLILENPGMPGQSKVTTSLYAGLQIVMPGEVAPAHRHSQSALRFVLESAGGHTTVAGERTTMQYGDFVITPNWAWHEHGNETDAPVIWLDGLDIPLVQFLDTSFAERDQDPAQNATRHEGFSMARFGSNMLPLEHRQESPVSPVFSYPYRRSREALETMRREDPWDPCHGLKMKYVNPLTGGWAMPTMGTCLQLLPRGFRTRHYRSTDATVFVAVEGRGASSIDGQTFRWQPRDVFVVPSWKIVQHMPDEDAVLFSFSDRPVQEALGLWREQVATEEQT